MIVLDIKHETKKKKEPKAPEPWTYGRGPHSSGSATACDAKRIPA